MLDYPVFLGYVTNAWSHGQDEYEGFDAAEPDDVDHYRREIDSVREVYTDLPLRGRVLDVGGHQGRLRRFLTPTSEYLVVDPYSRFASIASRPNLVRAYPELAEPCNFVRGMAERLPVAARSFDTVHMRSVLDHFADPLLALIDARRVLRDEGQLILGLHVTGGASSLSTQRSPLPRVIKKVRDEGLAAAFRAAMLRLVRPEHDHHLWHPTYEELIELVEAVGFSIGKVHWQKPPNDHVVYIQGIARARDADSRESSHRPS